MHPDHLHLMRNACIAAAIAYGANVAIILGEYVLAALD